MRHGLAQCCNMHAGGVHADGLYLDRLYLRGCARGQILHRSLPHVGTAERKSTRAAVGFGDCVPCDALLSGWSPRAGGAALSARTRVCGAQSSVTAADIVTALMISRQGPPTSARRRVPMDEAAL
jgi:hypothetical protein